MADIEYRKGYKYQLAATFEVDTGIIPPAPIETDFISLSIRGVLTIRKGYANDGPSGPTFDSPEFMAGALAHDALYQLMRLGYLPESYRKQADQLLRRMCIQNGMWKVRAAWVYAGVRIGAGPSSRPAHKRKIITAPAIGWRKVEA